MKNSYAPSFLFLAAFISRVYSSSAQDDSLIDHMYYELRGDSTLTIRIDELDGLPMLVFYPNGGMREHYRMSGLIQTSADWETLWVSFVMPADRMNLDVTWEDAMAYFQPWEIYVRENPMSNRLQLTGLLGLNSTVSPALVHEALNVTIADLEQWLAVHDQPSMDPEVVELSEPCEVMMGIIGLAPQGLHPQSLEDICSCAEWYAEKGVEIGQIWFDCALYSYIIMDHLTPQPMVTCRQPECLIPLKRVGESYMVELEFPSGKTEELMLFVEDVFLMMNQSQISEILTAEGWLPNELRRPDHAMGSSNDETTEFDHFGLPSFQVGDVTFSSQSVIAPKSGMCRPYFSAGLLSALGRWEVDTENDQIRIIPWAYLD